MKRTFWLIGFIVILSFYTSGAIASDLYGDFIDDNTVDMNDLRYFCELWLVNDYNLTAGVDLDGDHRVNFNEFSAFADNWKLTYTPNPAAPQNLMVPPMAYDDTTIILIWSKPVDYSQVTDYRVYQNGTALGLSGRFDTTRAKLYYNVTGLTANTTYNFTVKSLNSSGTEIGTSNVCAKTTAATPAVFYPEDYGAAADGTTKDTAAIQAAINACTAGGKVHLRAGKTFLSGSIFLKSNMTLQIDGTILGSTNPADYPFTCLRLPYYASGNNYMGLVNIYYNYNDPASAGKPYGSITDVRICGSGVINGCQGYSASNPHAITTYPYLTTLGLSEVSAQGRDSARGDLVVIKGTNNVYLGGQPGLGSLTVVYPACHTVIINYCNDVTVADVNLDTYDISNADGLDLGSSDTAYVFNSVFDTGDDCINTGAGVGQEGVDDNCPDQNIRVFDCTTLRGHGGFVIGSYTAAWVQDCLVEDLLINGTDKGIRQKTSQGGGGGGRRNLYRDIRIVNVVNEGIFLDSTYTLAKGYTPAATAGQFSGNTYKNISVSSTKQSIYINALNPPAHTNNTFYNITGNKAAYLNYCTNSTFNYCTVVGSPAWNFVSGTCSGLSGTNNTPQPVWP
ncbi:MAG: glycoside hydrolase family 28 protein [Sedimentisphaerales bacterium]